MGLFNRKPKAPAVEVPTYMITGDEAYGFDIVGESKYQGAIAQAVRRWSTAEDRENGRLLLDGYQATLHPEPDNRYDPDAVRVAIDGQTVGYVSADEAPGFAECVVWHLEQMGMPPVGPHGWVASANARIGWHPTAPDRMYGVRLDIEDDFWDVPDQ